jgi:hypothetical protein
MDTTLSDVQIEEMRDALLPRTPGESLRDKREDVRSAIQVIITTVPNQREVLDFMCTAWRETQMIPGETVNDFNFMSEHLSDRLFLAAFLEDPSLGQEHITEPQEQILTLFLEAAWAVEFPIQNARKTEARRKITSLAVCTGLHKRLGVNCRFRGLDEAVVRMIVEMTV